MVSFCEETIIYSLFLYFSKYLCVVVILCSKFKTNKMILRKAIITIILFIFITIVDLRQFSKWYFSQWNIDINLPYFLECFLENISLISKLQWCAFTTLGEASLISFYYSKFSTKSKTKFLSMQIICNGIYRGKFVEFQVFSSLKAKGNWLFQKLSVKIPFPNAIGCYLYFCIYIKR